MGEVYLEFEIITALVPTQVIPGEEPRSSSRRPDFPMDENRLPTLSPVVLAGAKEVSIQGLRILAQTLSFKSVK